MFNNDMVYFSNCVVYYLESNSHWSPLQLIHEAQREYRECARNCSCHYEQIKADLRPHREGITLQQVQEARPKSVAMECHVYYDNIHLHFYDEIVSLYLMVSFV